MQDSKHGSARHENFFGSYEINGLGGGIFSWVICVMMVFLPRKRQKHFRSFLHAPEKKPEYPHSEPRQLTFWLQEDSRKPVKEYISDQESYRDESGGIPVPGDNGIVGATVWVPWYKYRFFISFKRDCSENQPIHLQTPSSWIGKNGEKSNGETKSLSEHGSSDSMETVVQTHL